MTSAADLMDESRTKVLALVERELAITRSWMRAYENVGAMIGRSTSWIEKLIGRRLDTKRPDAVALLNIRACYARYRHVCERVEAAADEYRAARAALESDAHAPVASDPELSRPIPPLHLQAPQVPLEKEAKGVKDDPWEIPTFLVRKRNAP